MFVSLHDLSFAQELNTCLVFLESFEHRVRVHFRFEMMIMVVMMVIMVVVTTRSVHVSGFTMCWVVLMIAMRVRVIMVVVTVWPMDMTRLTM